VGWIVRRTESDQNFQFRRATKNHFGLWNIKRNIDSSILLDDIHSNRNEIQVWKHSKKHCRFVTLSGAAYFRWIFSEFFVVYILNWTYILWKKQILYFLKMIYFKFILVPYWPKMRKNAYLPCKGLICPYCIKRCNYVANETLNETIATLVEIGTLGVLTVDC
jgi:hypothetical protein